MTEYERMRAGRIYDCMDAELGAAQRESHRLCEAYNALGADDGEKKQALLQELFPGQDFGLYRTLEAPIFLDNAREIRIGKNFYANVYFSFIAGGQVEIGDNVFIGPYCTLATGIPRSCPRSGASRWTRTAACTTTSTAGPSASAATSGSPRTSPSAAA